MKSAFYNDNDEFCCKVLAKHIQSGELPMGYVDDRDIRDINADELVRYGQIHLFAGIGGIPLACRWAGMPDDFSIITGGFPCQDISEMGARAGINGKQSGLWREMRRIICRVRPRYALVENVSALLEPAKGRFAAVADLLGDLAEIGYDAEWQSISACAVGAPHTRERVFIVAYPASEPGLHEPFDGAHAERLPVLNNISLPALRDTFGEEFEAASRLCRTTDGIPARVDRCDRLGNAVNPYQVYPILKAIMDYEATAIPQ